MPESLTPVTDALNTGVGIGMLLSITMVAIFETTNWFFRLGVTSEVTIGFLAVSIAWDIAINYYLLYHRVTIPLPAWLGGEVTYGGMIPNVCDGAETLGDGGWACLPSRLETWFADVAGPRGWRYLAQPPAKFVVCLSFVAFNVGMLALLVNVLRKPKFLFEAQRRDWERRWKNREGTQREESAHCAEFRLDGGKQ